MFTVHSGIMERRKFLNSLCLGTTAISSLNFTNVFSSFLEDFPYKLSLAQFSLFRLEMMRNNDMILGAEKIADDSMIAMEDDDNGFRGRKNAILGEWIWKKTHLRTV